MPQEDSILEPALKELPVWKIWSLRHSQPFNVRTEPEEGLWSRERQERKAWGEGKPSWMLGVGFEVCIGVHQGSQVALVVKNPPANAGDTKDMGSILGLRRYPGEGSGNPLQYSCLENPMNRGTWLAVVHRVTDSQTRQRRLSTHTCIGVHQGKWKSLWVYYTLTYITRENAKWYVSWRGEISKYLAKVYMYSST